MLFAVNIGCPLPLQIPSHYQLPLFATSLSSPMIPHVSPAISNLSGYVQQQDVFIGAVTVREALMFSADLRLPKSTTPVQRAALVDETLRVLHLDPAAGMLIGDEEVPLFPNLPPHPTAHHTPPLRRCTDSNAPSCGSLSDHRCDRECFAFPVLA